MAHISNREYKQLFGEKKRKGVRIPKRPPYTKGDRRGNKVRGGQR